MKNEQIAQEHLNFIGVIYNARKSIFFFFYEINYLCDKKY